ncbi:unnamed protein product [Ostreobium quekettii]|uniref:SET domain-containing protein n=1 Tax=Ostreobium quekettii TaxID=121088 RepID=A0A8S1JEF4_9CHLO|nr:unnamed protein product [Ostreobium quekettii]|eukprot:evm.model.scf_354.7 EVM.evm.TU.scf_354.7   scf_354:54686-57697(+)
MAFLRAITASCNRRVARQAVAGLLQPGPSPGWPRQAAQLWRRCSNAVERELGPSARWAGADRQLLLLVFAASGCTACGVAYASKRDGQQKTEGSKFRSQGAVDHFMAWLKSRGADLEAVQVLPSQDMEQSGLGLCAAPAMRDRQRTGILGTIGRFLHVSRREFVAASFPLSSSLTVETACSDKAVGPSLQGLLDTGQIDEHDVLAIFLMVQKLLGSDSEWAPWLQLLPDTPQVPLYFSEREWQELRGTTIERAAAAIRDRLKMQWQHIEQECKDFTAKAGASKKPSFSDFLWAQTILGSRSIHVPVNEGGESTFFEAIVPGLDFCNHVPAPGCRWVPSKKPCRKQPGSNKDGDTSHMHIDLVADPRKPLQPGTQLNISYGDRSNEELLFQYGFSLELNPNDALMISCPLEEPTPHSPSLEPRLRLLRSYGLKPQFFLPNGEALHLAKSKATELADLRAKGRLAGSLRGVFPDRMWKVLEVFVMEPEEVASRLGESSPGSQGMGRSIPKKGGNLRDLGLEMAAATTLVRLLEMKMVEMEGPEGTGRLEDDIKIIEEANSGASTMSQSKWSCLVYRAQQKHLVREWLDVSGRHLQDVMNRLEGAVA